MNGAADLGGMMGFGPVQAEADEPAFHADWEKRIFAITLAMGFTASWNLDQSRFARESLPPAQYLNSSYYQIWLAGLEKLMLEQKLISDREIATGKPDRTDKPDMRILAAANVTTALARGGPMERPFEAEALYSIGDRVKAKNMHPSGHTRLPRYLRGHVGTIRSVRGHHVFPDSNAAGLGEDPQWLYSVEFSARELWGEGHAATDTVTADCWEPYLESI